MYTYIYIYIFIYVYIYIYISIHTYIYIYINNLQIQKETISIISIFTTSHQAGLRTYDVRSFCRRQIQPSWRKVHWSQPRYGSCIGGSCVWNRNGRITEHKMKVFYRGGTAIAGWFIVENPSINGGFRGTPILGNLHIWIYVYIYIYYEKNMNFEAKIQYHHIFEAVTQMTTAKNTWSEIWDCRN